MISERILKEFAVLNEKIVDADKLHEYVDFCIANDVGPKIPGKTSSHHILPNAATLPFRKFGDLKIHAWNKSELSYADHYRAHFLLMQAVDHYSTIFAFCSMHNKDIKLSRLSSNDLLSEAEFEKIWSKRNKKIKSHLAETVIIDGVQMTRAKARMMNVRISDERRKASSKRMKENNPSNNEVSFAKMRNAKRTKTIDGKNMDTIGAERAAKTMRNNGTYEITAKKISEKRLQVMSDGRSLASHLNEKVHKKLRAKSKLYKVKNVFDENYCEILPAYEVRKISAKLPILTRENYLGMTNYGKSVLIKSGRESLIGLYCEMLE